MKKKTKIALITSSIVLILLAGVGIIGGTYSLFTSTSKTNIAITSGKIDVVANIDTTSLKTYSGVDLKGEDGDTITENVTAGTFTNGGSAKLEGGTLKLEKMTPGDKVTFKIDIKNNSSLAIKYRTNIKKGTEDDGLFGALTFKVDNTKITGNTSSDWSESFGNSTSGTVVKTLNCEVFLDSTKGNTYKEKKCSVVFEIEATQAISSSSGTGD